MSGSKKIKAPDVHAAFKNAALNPGGEFELALSNARMDDILQNKSRDLMINPEAEYAALSPANQRALTHLVKATKILNDVFLKQDHADNIRARDILRDEAATGHPVAIKALKIFTMQNGLQGSDLYAGKTTPMPLFKNKSVQKGAGFYPPGITRDEVVDYITAHPESASAIFGNNTMVVRDGDDLRAVPYSVAFAAEMSGAARELLAAARETDHAGFADYLRWQAQALVNDSDPEVMYRADKAWIALADSPLEFTIGRESYADTMSKDVGSDPAVAPVLAANGIRTKAKDMFGIRAGIVNTGSIAQLNSYRNHLDSFRMAMPLYEEYAEQSSVSGDSMMTYADVDLVSIAGSYAAHRGGVAQAQSLPNGDKLSTQLKVGSRQVFHRQIRKGADPVLRQRFLDTLVDRPLHALYDENADFNFVIGHEFVHTLGPVQTKDARDKKVSLGKRGDIIEECKADVGSIALTGSMLAAGVVTPEQAHSIFLTWAARGLPAKQPADHEAHAMRSIMQMNYFREHGAIIFEAGGKLRIDTDKMVPVAEKMLQDVIALQLAGDSVAAEAYVVRHAAWNDALQYAVDEQMKFDRRLYRTIQQPLRDSLVP